MAGRRVRAHPPPTALPGPVYSRKNVASHSLHATYIIDEVYCGIVTALSNAAVTTIPRMAPRVLKHWWYEDLNRLKQRNNKNLFHWRAADKPPSGHLFDTYRQGRIEFRKAIKKKKLEVKKGASDSLLHALGNSKNFWSLWRSKLGTKKKLPTRVNGLSDEGEIAAAFATHFYTE